MFKMSSRRSKIINNYCDDEELVYDSGSDLIDILNSDAISSKKLACLHHLVTNFVKQNHEGGSQNDLLESAVVHTKELLNSLFEKCFELSFENQEEMCMRTLEMIRSTLEMVVDIIEVLEDLISYIPGSNLPNQTFSLHLCDILYKTFLHCKESHNIYLIYYNSINEILLITFKKAQEVHSKLLKLLEFDLVINNINEDEILLLKNILCNLVNIGIVLSGMNVKAMVDNWKGYTTLTRKYSEFLAKNMDLNQPLQLLMTEILMNLKGVFEIDMDDLTTITYTLKVGNFLAKVLSKLCFTFWDDVTNHSETFWKFFIELYSYSTPHVKKDLFCTAHVVSLIKLYLLDALESLIEKLSFEEQFCSINDKFDNHSYSYVLFIEKILKYWANKLAKCPIHQYNVDGLLKHLIKCLDTTDFILQSTSIYQELIIKMSLVISNLDEKNFSCVENELCKNIFNKNVMVSVFCQEIWLEVIKLTPLSYNYEVLCVLIDRFMLVLNAKIYVNPLVYLLTNYLRKLFMNLSNDYRMQFLLKYPVNKNLVLWKSIGLDLVSMSPRFKQDVDVLCVELTKYVELFLLRSCSLDQYLNLVNLLNVTATIPSNELSTNLNKLSSLLIEMWILEFNEDIIDSPFFNLLLEGMINLTLSLISKFNEQQLIEILKTLQSLIKVNDTSKIHSIKIIKKLIFIPNMKNSNTILFHIEEMITALLTANQTVLTNEILNLIRKCPNVKQKTFLENTLKKNYDFNTKYETFLKSNNDNSVNTMNISNLILNQTADLAKSDGFHKCVQWSVEPKIKKMKLDENVDLEKVLNKIKEDVYGLKELIKREPFQSRHVDVIHDVIGDLQLCLK
ncbi:FIGNL1-interacting regulator of recombination and mitosis-like [Onthophagus taurus]|uniref:FIGNL1-interacting regulator of recombination and mitosis-like n=1 Tax=Onthophagus taurus TaxID=166361 RepID=UPI0039BE7831